MKIINGLSQMYTTNVKPTSQKDTLPTKSNVTTATSDKIELSSLSKEVNRYIELSKASDIDPAEKIARIKEQLSSGTYEVSNEQLANAIIKQFK